MIMACQSDIQLVWCGLKYLEMTTSHYLHVKKVCQSSLGPWGGFFLRYKIRQCKFFVVLTSSIFSTSWKQEPLIHFGITMTITAAVHYIQLLTKLVRPLNLYYVTSPVSWRGLLSGRLIFILHAANTYHFYKQFCDAEWDIILNCIKLIECLTTKTLVLKIIMLR